MKDWEKWDERIQEWDMVAGLANEWETRAAPVFEECHLESPRG